MIILCTDLKFQQLFKIIKMSGVCARVFFDVTIDDLDAGRVEIDLFSATPKTAENFRCLCTGEKGVGKAGRALHFKDTMFHRVIPGFMA